jgi:hypothetical protein
MSSSYFSTAGSDRARLVLSNMLMLPHYYNATAGHSGIEFFLFLCPDGPVTKTLRRILNQPKKRRSPARIGRYFGIIGARGALNMTIRAYQPSCIAPPAVVTTRAA